MFLAKTLLVAATLGSLALAAPGAADGTHTTPIRAERVALASGAQTPRVSSRARPLLRRIVRSLVRHGAPGALAVVRTPTRIRRAASGLANRHPRAGLRATDRFRVASVTKPFVATLVLQLVAEGKVRLNDTVEGRLPGLVPNGDAITIRELLDHTSGLFDYTNDEALVGAAIANPGREWAPRELVAVATSHPPLHPPGKGWSYSNTNYILLGLVIEAVTGTTLEHQLRERLFQPLALTRTSFPSGTQVEGRFVHGYIGPATLPVAPGTLLDMSAALSPSWGWAAGGILSNGDDVTRFFAALLGGRLLPRGLLSAMRTVAPGSEYGLGLMRTRTACGVAYGHLGDFTGYRSVVYARPNGRRVAVVMVNIDTTHVSWYELETAAETAYCSRV